MGKAPLWLCTHSTHRCCPGSAEERSWAPRGSGVREAQLCLGELVISHLSGIISQPPIKPGEGAALVSCPWCDPSCSCNSWLPGWKRRGFP